ncbi:phage tail protein [Opitutaceae bacterium TAV4]|nr:phage tail protein [Opitutaceae bacterium TAV4]RRK00808.1 phage tail protein [Opitutaceae bacterium TAV3]
MPTDFLHGVEVLEVNNGPRAIRTVKTSVIGIVGTAPEADVTAFPLNKPVLIAASRREAALLGETGTLPAALDDIFDQAGAVVIVVRVAPGEGATPEAIAAATLTNIIGGVGIDGSTGIQCLVDAESVVGFSPKILIATGFTDKKACADELLSIADRLRAIVVLDGPNTTDEAAITYAGDFGNARAFLVDPGVKVFANGDETVRPASARVAGLIAKSDNDRGFWWSPSNQEILGITGTARPVDFLLGDPNSRANLLNEQNVATIIRQDGFRLWGNRTLSSDPKFAFLSTRRTADVIADSIKRGHMWANDRPVSRQLCESIADSVNSYLRSLVAMGAILGGVCWYDRADNENNELAQGKIRFRYKFTPPPPAERLTFVSETVEDYYDVIFG